jgi:enterochelin esterase-like enzyme
VLLAYLQSTQFDTSNTVMSQKTSTILRSILFLAIVATPPGLSAQGISRQTMIPSREYGRDRRMWVYTPPGYDAKRKDAYPLVVMFDGAEAIDPNMMDMPGTLDSLLAAKAAPAFVAVFIDDSAGAVRTGELGNSAKFGRFMIGEVIPFVRKNWNVTRDPHRTIITGSSAGGIAAANLALFHPEIFGNVISQSGAFWRGNEGSNSAPWEWLTSQYASAPKRDVKFVMDVGALETVKVLGGAGPEFIEANRRLRDALVSKGYSVIYTEVPNGQHAPQFWKPRLPVDLVAIVKDWN